ncbi:MAG: ribose 5-phosphate isomerase B [Clostridia bacterium]|nr:ribose 5-phosphate isomerase B [Clostridia bacterium]
MTVALGCDHAGFALKDDVLTYLESLGVSAVYCGTDSEESVDYPLIADAVCKKVQNGEASLAVLICGTGIGMSIAANKHTGIRAAVCWNTECASLARRHNDANVVCLGARMLDPDLIKAIVKEFISTGFEGGRHGRRVEMLNSLDK